MSAENPPSIRSVISQFVTQERDFKRSLQEAYVANFDGLVAKIDGHKRREDVVVDKYDREPAYITVKDVDVQGLKAMPRNGLLLATFDDGSLVEIQMSRYGQIKVIDRNRKIAVKVNLNIGEVDAYFGSVVPDLFFPREISRSPREKAFLVRDLTEATEQIISERLQPQPVS